MIRMIRGVIVSAFLMPLAVHAQEDALPDTFALNIGALYIHDSDTEFSARDKSGIGTIINYDRDLNGDDSATVPRVSGYYRFNPRHRIDFSYYELDRDGRKVINEDINFGDVTFPVNINVESSIDAATTKLAYTWSFYHVDKVELGASVGAHVMSYDLKLRSSDASIVESRSVTGPLPVLGFRSEYSINPRWSVLFDIDTFYIEFGDQFRGSLNDLQLAVEYRAFRHVSFGVSANRTSLDVRVDDGDFRGSVDDVTRGGQLYVGLHY